MSIGIWSIEVYRTNAKILASYAAIDYAVWEELNKYSMELDLKCLSFVQFEGNILFNDLQYKEILVTEIPALRGKSISNETRITLDELEFAIKDIRSKNAWAYLLFEGN